MKENFFIYRKKDRAIISPLLINSKSLAEDYMHTLKDNGIFADGNFAVGTVFIKGKKIFDTEPRGFATSELNKLILKKINYKAK